MINPGLYLQEERSSLPGLLGYYTPLGSWVDGILSIVLREALLDESTEISQEYWIVLDGAMRASWMFGIGGLLADESALILPSFERVSVSSSLRLLLESDSLHHACPSVLASCALVAVGSCQPPASKMAEMWLEAHTAKGMDPDAVQRFREVLTPLLEAALGAVEVAGEERNSLFKASLSTRLEGLRNVPQASSPYLICRGFLILERHLLRT